jgi:uncharacterized membrane protein
MTARTRLLLATPPGLIVGTAVALLANWRVGIMLGWDTTAVIILASLWPTLWPMTPEQTKAHAVREDPSRELTDLVIVGAALASLLAVALVIVGARDKNSTKGLLVALAIASIIISWALVHSVFATRYAHLYYSEPPGGIDFKTDDDRPTYTDFAYVAFTVGMTFQVADTDLQSTDMRKAVLRHALIAYVFGAVIIAATINLVAGLGSSSG